MDYQEDLLRASEDDLSPCRKTGDPALAVAKLTLEIIDNTLPYSQLPQNGEALYYYLCVLVGWGKTRLVAQKFRERDWFLW